MQVVRKYIVVGWVLACMGTSAMAAESAPRCSPTTAVSTQNYPGANRIPAGNNLLLPAGKSLEAEGQRIIVHVQVLDRNCAPIPQATVELWQVDPFGRWLLAGADDLATPNPVFAGAGRTYTDENGMAYFITAFPAPVNKRAPNVNIKIKAEGMSDFSTALFFDKDNRNTEDDTLKKLQTPLRRGVSLAVEQGADGVLIASTAVVLPGVAPYRTY